MELGDTTSVSDPRSLTPVSQFTRYEVRSDAMLSCPLPSIASEPKKEHDETMQRYDRLLAKMRTTDEQLRTLSRSWATHSQATKSSVGAQLEYLHLCPSIIIVQVTSQSESKRKEANDAFVSPLVLQMSLIVLLIFNLLVVYFFNEIHLWWSEYVGHSVLAEHHHEQTSKY